MNIYRSLRRAVTAASFFAFSAAAFAQQPTENAQRQIAALLSEKAARNPAQQKIDSHLVHAAEILSGRPVHPDFPVPPGELEAVHRDGVNNVEIDITADVTTALLDYLRSLGGVVINSFPQYQSIRARMPLLAVERFAGRSEVRQVRMADYGHGNAGPDTNGDIAHAANIARETFGFDGTGVRIGILSDGVNSLKAEQTAGRLPQTVNVITGQAGNGDEGTAMLEIVYTLAPGATLYFATASGGQAAMANNIRLLASAGCQIIIDDYTYFAEGVFEDDIVAGEVNAVAASGVIYFSDAQNSGSLLMGTSGTWEGDFSNSGVALPPIAQLQATGGEMHNFGTASNVVAYDALTALTPSGSSFTGDYELKWSDPLGGSSNDYDLFILDPTMTKVLGSSTNVQNGTQNPEEAIGANDNFPALSRIVIVKGPGAASRALHLDTERGRLQIGTTGATFGHNAASGAYTMAASSAKNSDGGVFTGGASDPIEAFSSDGPRRMFYNSNGTAITPGNLLFGTNGGTVLNKPDLTAADGVTTGVTGYTTFSGTSAAGPHAGAISALVLQAEPSTTNAQLRAALTGSALDIDAPGFDVNSGVGIVMAPGALSIAARLPILTITLQQNGSFAFGEAGATYTAIVANATAASPASQPVTVTMTLAAGLTLASASGTGWSCSGLTCTRSDALAAGANYPPIVITVNIAPNAAATLTSQASITYKGAIMASASETASVKYPVPAINPGGIGPLYSKASAIEPSSWVTIYGTNLSLATASWDGTYPTSLGGVSVEIHGQLAYLAYVSPTQINLQAPDDTTVGSVAVSVMTGYGTASSTVTLATVSPSLNMFDTTHPAGVILTPEGTGAYAGGAYDYVGPSGAFSFSTRPVKPGEILLLYGTGFGPTLPAVRAGKSFSGSAATTNPVTINIGSVPVTPISSVMYASGAYQIALVVPNAGHGDVPMTLTVAGAQTPANIVVTLQ